MKQSSNERMLAAIDANDRAANFEVAKIQYSYLTPKQIADRRDLKNNDVEAMSNMKLKWEDLWSCEVNGISFLERVYHYRLDDWIKKYYDKHKANGGAHLLLWAVATRQDDAVINNLLDTGALINAVEPAFKTNQARFGNRTPLYIACSVGDLPRVKLLLARLDVAINQRCSGYRDTALAVASQNGHLSVVKVLLQDQRTVVTAIDDRQSSPLIPACLSGDLSVVEALLEDERIDVNAATNNRKRPLGVVCGKSDMKSIKIAERLLQQTGIIIDDINKHGETALHKVLSIDELDFEQNKQVIIDLVKILIAHPSGADINKVNRFGETALHLAVKLNSLDLVLQFLSHPDCIVDVEDQIGATPLSLAMEENNMDIIPLLEAALALVNCEAP